MRKEYILYIQNYEGTFFQSADRWQCSAVALSSLAASAPTEGQPRTLTTESDGEASCQSVVWTRPTLSG